ncbi:MAG: hypothetical protein P8184_19580 [Calditrichia bacterium]
MFLGRSHNKKKKLLAMGGQYMCLIIAAFQLGELVARHNFFSIESVLFPAALTGFLYLKFYEKEL